MKLYMAPKNALFKLSEGDGRIFKFVSVDQTFAVVKTENGSTIKLPSTYDVIYVGKYND